MEDRSSQFSAGIEATTKIPSASNWWLLDKPAQLVDTERRGGRKGGRGGGREGGRGGKEVRRESERKRERVKRRVREEKSEKERAGVGQHI